MILNRYKITFPNWSHVIHQEKTLKNNTSRKILTARKCLDVGKRTRRLFSFFPLNPPTWHGKYKNWFEAKFHFPSHNNSSVIALSCSYGKYKNKAGSLWKFKSFSDVLNKRSGIICFLKNIASLTHLYGSYFMSRWFIFDYVAFVGA